MLTELQINIMKVDNKLSEMTKRQNILLRSLGPHSQKRTLPVGKGIQAARELKYMR